MIALENNLFWAAEAARGLIVDNLVAEAIILTAFGLANILGTVVSNPLAKGDKHGFGDWF